MAPGWFRNMDSRRWTVSLLVCGMLTLAGVPILRKHVTIAPSGTITVSSDVLVYVDAARDLLAGRNFYDRPGEFPYIYPPFYAVINVPLVFVDPLLLDIAWYLLNVGFLVGLLHMAFFLFTGRSLASQPAGKQWLYLVLPIVLAARYLVRNAQQANVNLFIVFLIVLGLFLVRRTGRARWASLVGIAAAIKVLPIVFLVYFLPRRMWRALAAAVLALVIATAVPIVVVGFEKNREYLLSFMSYVNSRLSPSGVAVENFSLWGTLGRVLSRQPAFTIPGASPTYVNLMNLDLGVVRALVQGLHLLLLALVFLVSRRSPQTGGDPWRLSGGALVVTLLVMNLASVLIEDHHCVGFVVAHLYLLVVWREGPRVSPLWVGLMFGAALLSNAISHDLIVPLFGKETYMRLLAFSLPVLPVAIVLLLLTLRSLRVAGAGSTLSAVGHAPTPPPGG